MAHDRSELSAASARSRSSGANSIVTVRAFGPWHVEVDGTPATAVKSRYARELLIAFSLQPGPIARDTLIGQVRPDAPDHRTARRRLTRELSRLQAAVGTTLWSTTPDLIAVADTATIDSDVADVVAFFGHQQRSGDRSREAWELSQLLERFDAGPLLAGHESEWVEQLRSRLGAHETELRHRLLSLLSPVDAAEALGHARRLVELNPFDDRAHGAVVRSLRATRDVDAANAYADEISRLYARELNGAPLPQTVQIALTEPRNDPPALHAEIAGRRQIFDAAGGGLERRAAARLLDDALRAAGHQQARVELLPLLAAWRQAEVMLHRGEPEQAEAVLKAAADSSDSEGDDVDHPGWTTLVWGLFHHMHGRNTLARELFEGLLDEALPPALGIEANLRLERVLDAVSDTPGSRRCCFAALDLARDHGDVAARAAALTSLGWSLSRSYRIAEAATTLAQALDLAESVGAESVRATALGGLANLAYWGRRHGSAAAYLQAAAAISRRTGDLASLVRWLTNEAVPQSTIGNYARLVDLLAELQAMRPELLTPPGQARVLQIELRLALHRQESDRAFALFEDLSEHFVATEERLPHLTSRNELVDFHLELGNGTEALALAQQNEARAAELDLDPTWLQILRMRTGAALIATGDLAGGVAILDEAIEHGEPGQILSAPCYATYHEALTALGRHDEARLVRHSIRHMLEALRHDLTPEQWKTAVRSAPDVRAVLPIAGLDER